MKKILLLSDTHSYIGADIISYAKKADEVWHAGDIGNLEIIDCIEKHTPVRAVFGNIDDISTRKTFPETQRFLCENLDVLMTHIGGYPGKYSPKTKIMLSENPPKLFICGHSHILKVIWDKTHNLLHINPGAAGKYGIHQVRTMVRFIITDGVMSSLEIIELGRRV